MIKLYWPKHDLDADFWQLFCLVRKAKGSSIISLISDDHRPVLVHNSSLAWSSGPLMWDSQPLFLIRQFSESCSLLLTSSDNDFSFCCLDLSLRSPALSAECICKWNVWVTWERPGREAAGCGGLCQRSSLQELSALGPTPLLGLGTPHTAPLPTGPPAAAPTAPAAGAALERAWSALLRQKLPLELHLAETVVQSGEAGASLPCQHHILAECHSAQAAYPLCASFLVGVRCVSVCACSVTSVMPDSLWPVDCTLPGSSVHRILQARILEWVAMPFSRGSSWSRDQTCVSYIFCIVRWVLYH